MRRMTWEEVKYGARWGGMQVTRLMASSDVGTVVCIHGLSDAVEIRVSHERRRWRQHEQR